jgi:hypothetical protein
MTINPISLAKFMVLPGASELVEAFSAIPDGLLRTTIVQHAQAIAITYNDARESGAPIPDPFSMIPSSAISHPGRALPDPNVREPRRENEALPPPQARANGRGVKLETVGSQVVRLRLSGLLPNQIALQLEVPLDDVTDALKAARKAGVKFARLPKGAAGGTNDGKYKWATSLDQIPRGPRAQTEKAALNLGLSAEAYFERKLKVVEMRQAGASDEAIYEYAKPAPPSAVWRWIYQARKAGLNVRVRSDDLLDAAKPAPSAQLMPDPAITPRRFFPPYDALNPKQQRACVAAARRRGMTPEQYAVHRERILTLRWDGHGPKAIATQVGEKIGPVKDIIAHYCHANGLAIPAVTL